MSEREEALRKAGIKVIQGKKVQAVTQLDFSKINEEFVGSFKFHRPSLIEQMRIGVIKSQLLAGMVNVDILTDNIAHMTATLQVVLDDAPEWFNPDNLDEYEVLDGVYEKYMEFFRSFQRRDKKADDAGDSEATGE